MKRVVFTADAENEISQAATWYASRREGLGRQFLYSLETTIEIVSGNPEIYPIILGQARRAVLRRFPYSLIYLALEDTILIVACLIVACNHAHRDLEAMAATP